MRKTTHLTAPAYLLACLLYTHYLPPEVEEPLPGSFWAPAPTEVQIIASGHLATPSASEEFAVLLSGYR